MKSTSIYGLIDPVTQQIRYVGKTIEPIHRRLKSHVTARTSINPINRWVAKLFRAGLKPEIFQIESVETNWQEAEQYWITYFRYIGADLLNIAPGGDWCPRHAESNRRRAETVKRMGATDGQLRAILDLRRRLAEDESLRAEWYSRQQASIKTPEYRAKMSALKKGVKSLPGGRHRPESLAIMSLKAKAREARRRAARGSD
jgi:hypothetical protein